MISLLSGNENSTTNIQGKKLYSLQLTLTSISVTLIVVVSLAILTISYLTSSQSMRMLSKEMTTEVSKGITEKIYTLLNNAESAGHMGRFMITQGMVNTDEGQSLLDLATLLISQNNTFSTVDIALPDGSKYQATRLNDGSLAWRSDIRSSKNVVRRYLYENPDFPEKREDSIRSPDRGYDARKRPWFKKGVAAKRPVWTDMYISGAEKLLVYSFVTPVYDENHRLVAVIAIDLQLESLSRFLGGLKIFDHGKSFILNQARQVIAIPIKSASELSQLMKQAETGSDEPFQLYETDELPNHNLRSAIVNYQSHGKNFFDFIGENGRNHNGFITDYTYNEDLSFSIGIIFPDEDILKNVNQNTRFMLAAGSFLLILAIVAGIRVARSVSATLSSLSEEVDKVARLELDSERVVESRIVEVARINDSVEGMRYALRSFKKYVPSRLVQQLNQLKQEAVLGGESAELTVFFSDIANFTAISEMMTPSELVQQLAHYFDGMSNIILEGGGTLDKYIGDAIMSFWGAPVTQPSHAVMACQAALQCQKFLAALATQSQASSNPVFHTRIGIHTGEVVVGNIGCEERMNYTIIGDAANLASRLESLNKFYDTRIIISQETLKQTGNAFVARKLDTVAVKGKSQGVEIFELVGTQTEITAEYRQFLDLYHQGLELYLTRHWEEAAVTFREATRLAPGLNDRPCEIYLHRCEVFLDDPPPENWDAVYKHDSK